MKINLLKKFTIFLISIIILNACGSNKQNLPINTLLQEQIESKSLSITSIQNSTKLNIYPVSINDLAEFPYIFQRQDGSFIISYNSKVHGNRKIFIRTSNDGITWSESVKATNNKLSDSHPQIIEDNSGKLILFYISNKTGAWKIYKTTSSDGINWTESTLIPIPDGQTGNIVNFSVIYDSNKIILVYQYLGGGIFITKFLTDKWEKPVEISKSGENPCLLKDKNNNYILAYQDIDYENTTNIFVSYSNDLIQWKKMDKITNFQYAKDPNIIQYNGEYILTFSLESNPGVWNIYQQKSKDLKNWSHIEKLTDNNKLNSQPCRFVGKNGVIFITWTVEDPDNWSSGIFIGIPKK